MIRWFQRAAFAPDASCDIDATASFDADGARLVGWTLQLSRAGALFRPSSAFLQARDGEAAWLTLGDRRIAATVVASAPDGYRLRFLEPPSAADLDGWRALSRAE